MTHSIVPRIEITPREWDDLVRHSPDGWVFSLWGWQELILNVPKWGLEDRSFAIRQRNELIGVVPLQFSASSRKMSSSGWGGSGPVLSNSLTDRQRQTLLRMALAHSEKLARESGALAVEFSCSPVTASSIMAPWGVNPFELAGMRDRSSLSQIIDLSKPEEELWLRMSERARKDVPRSKSLGYSVARVPWRAHVDDYYALHESTYRRTGVAPHPKAYFQGIADHLSDDGHSVLWMARGPDGRPAAFHNSARFGAGGYYHTGCSTERASDDGANYALFWEAMIDAKRNGVLSYDAGSVFPASTDKKQIGLTFFKTRFGGAPHRAFAAELEIPTAELTIEARPNIARHLIERLLPVARRIVRLKDRP